MARPLLTPFDMHRPGSVFALRTAQPWHVTLFSSALLLFGPAACLLDGSPQDEPAEAEQVLDDAGQAPTDDGGGEPGSGGGPSEGDAGTGSDPSNPGDPNGGPSAFGARWADRFALPGIIDGLDHPAFSIASVGEAVAVDPTGRVYVGGSRFGAAEQATIRGIASWDGSEWKALGRGIEGEAAVHAIAASATDVYVSGEFANAGGVQANGIARWNVARGEWSALGSGLRRGTALGVGRVLALFNGRVILGGSFDQVSGVAARNIAAWDPATQTWAPLGNGVSGPVTALSVSGAQLIVGGSFSSAGNTAASGIAVWDGNTWRSVPGRDDGQRPQGIVGAVAARGNTWLIAERSTTGAGGTLTITRGTANSLSVTTRSFGAVYSAATVGQDFLLAGAGGVYRWTGDTNAPTLILSRVEAVQPSGALGPAPVRALAADGRGGFYITGEFTHVRGTPARTVARFDGTQTTNLCGVKGLGVSAFGASATSPAADAPVEALVRSGSSVYAGGAFSAVGCTAALRVARWDGTAWTPLGAGLNDTVRALAVQGASLYAGGAFTQAGEVPAARVAAWNGTTWQALGAGMDDEVSTLLVSGGRLIAGGAFRSAGVPNTAHIAAWDGARWSSLGGSADAPVRVLAGDGDRIVAGGEFSSIGGVSASRIALWNGATWVALGGGLDGPVHGVVVRGDEVYVQGEFTRAGDVVADGLARWDGATWHALGDRRAASRTLGIVRDRLFAVLQGFEGGLQVATWDGAAWTSLGPPITAPVSGPRPGSLTRAALATEDSIYLGGRFSWVGDAASGRGLFSGNFGQLILTP